MVGWRIEKLVRNTLGAHWTQKDAHARKKTPEPAIHNTWSAANQRLVWSVLNGTHISLHHNGAKRRASRPPKAIMHLHAGFRVLQGGRPDGIFSSFGVDPLHGV